MPGNPQLFNQDPGLIAFPHQVKNLMTIMRSVAARTGGVIAVIRIPGDHVRAEGVTP